MPTNTTLIIGAGIAGLAAARKLADAGQYVLVIDKGRGVGGRMATRHMGDTRLDHGAQYFSAKTPVFQQFVKEAQRAGAVLEWRPGIPDVAHPRWVGNSGMNVVAKYLLQDVPVLKGKRITQIMAEPHGWTVLTEKAEAHSGEALLITMPAPQALDLLQNSLLDLPVSLHDRLREVEYQPCLAVLATLHQPSGIPAPGGIRLDDEPLAWLADNFQKGVSKIPSVTIHATFDFSQKHLDGDLQRAGRDLLDAAAPWVPAHSIVDWQIHRWRFSRAHRRLPEPFLEADTPFPLLFGGDGFGIGNVEGAYLSGLAMAQRLLERVSV
jgi:hypothetical protein